MRVMSVVVARDKCSYFRIVEKPGRWFGFRLGLGLHPGVSASASETGVGSALAWPWSDDAPLAAAHALLHLALLFLQKFLSQFYLE